MSEIAQPSISLTYTAYQMFNDCFRDDLNVERNPLGKVVATSSCDLVGRVIASGFVYALLEVMALVECVVRLVLFVPGFLVSLAGMVCCEDADKTVEGFSVWLMMGAFASLCAPTSLIAAQYFNVSTPIMPPTDYLALKTSLFACLVKEDAERQKYDDYLSHVADAVNATETRLSGNGAAAAALRS